MQSATSLGPSASSAPSYATAAASVGGASSADRSTGGPRSRALPLSVQSDGIAPSGGAVAAAATGPGGAPVGTSPATQVAFLQSQLDAIAPRQVLLGRFRLLGATERRLGGALLAPTAVYLRACLQSRVLRVG